MELESLAILAVLSFILVLIGSKGRQLVERAERIGDIEREIALSDRNKNPHALANYGFTIDKDGNYVPTYRVKPHYAKRIMKGDL